MPSHRLNVGCIPHFPKPAIDGDGQTAVLWLDHNFQHAVNGLWYAENYHHG